MKHIKPYKIFESKSFPTKVREDIEDIFRELDLIGIEFTIKDNFFLDRSRDIRADVVRCESIEIDIVGKGLISFKDIEDCILRLPDYFKTLDGEYNVFMSSKYMNKDYNVKEFISKYEYHNLPNIEVIIIKYD